MKKIHKDTLKKTEVRTLPYIYKTWTPKQANQLWIASGWTVISRSMDPRSIYMQQLDSMGMNGLTWITRCPKIWI